MANTKITEHVIKAGSITTGMLHSSFNTDGITEGSSNLFFTNERVDDRVNALLVAGTGITLTYNDAANTLTVAGAAQYGDSDVESYLSGGTGVTYSSGTISIGQAVGTSDNVTFNNVTVSGTLSSDDITSTNISASGNLTVTGNLTVSGTTTTVNSNTVNIGDNILVLNSDETGTPSQNAGIEIERGTSSNVQFQFKESTDKWQFTNDGSTYIDLATDTDGLAEGSTNLYHTTARGRTAAGISSTTGSISVPAGTTAQRDSSPANGMFRYNSDANAFEGYADGAWGSIGGGSGTFTTDSFTGNGSTTAFTLSSTPNTVLAFIEGVYQNDTVYSLSANVITFATAPANGRVIKVMHVTGSDFSGVNAQLANFTGNGSTTAYTLPANPNHENNIQVYFNGVYQQKNTFSVSGTTLTFGSAPANGVSIEVILFGSAAIGTPNANTVGVTQLSLSDGTNGQVLTTDGNGNISFTSIPASYADSDVETYLDGGTSTPVFASGASTGGFNFATTSGNVGIGTASPSSILHLYANDPQIILDDSGTQSSITGQSGNILYKTSSANRDHVFYGVSTEVARITGDGKVGIGRSPSTANLLDVAGKGYFGPVGTNQGDTKANMLTNAVLQLKPHDSNSTNMTFAQVNGGSGMGIQVSNGSQTANWDIALNPYGGDVGIGTASPDGQLHVKGSTNKTLKLDPTFSSGTYTSLAFARNGSDLWRVFQNSADEYLSFYNDGNSSYDFSLTDNSKIFVNVAPNNFSSYGGLGHFIIKQTADDMGIGIIDSAAANTLKLINNGTVAKIEHNGTIPIQIKNANGVLAEFNNYAVPKMNFHFANNNIYAVSTTGDEHSSSNGVMILKQQISVSAGSKIIVWYDSGQILNNNQGGNGSANSNPQIAVYVSSNSSAPSRGSANMISNNTDHYWYPAGSQGSARLKMNGMGATGTISTAGTYYIYVYGGSYNNGSYTFNYQNSSSNTRGSSIIWAEVMA